MNYRLVGLIGGIIAVIILFAVAGLPYDRFSWMQHSWAQSPYVPDQASAPGELACINPPPAPALTPLSKTDYFLVGRQDIDGDRLLNEEDNLTLYLVNADNDFTLVSLEGEAIIAIAVNNERDQVAYIVRDAGNLVLKVFAVETQTTTEIALPPLDAVTLGFGETLWVAGNSDTNNPPRLFEIDVEAGELVGNYILDRSNTLILFSRHSNFMLAYTPSLGQLQFLRLEAGNNPLEFPLGFLLEENFLTLPHWSAENQVFVGLEDPESPGSLIVFLADIEQITNDTIEMFGYPADADWYGAWSHTGAFIVLYSDFEQSPLTIITAEDQTVNVIEGQGLRFVPLDWIEEDHYLLLTREDGGLCELLLYDTATALSEPLGLQVLAVTGHPTEPLFTFLTETDGVFAIQNYSVETGEITLILTSDDASLLEASLWWTEDGENLLLLKESADPLAEMLGVSRAVFIVDTDEGIIKPLSPEGVEVQ